MPSALEKHNSYFSSVFPKSSATKSFTRALLSKNTIFIKISVVDGAGRPRNLFVRPSVRPSVRPAHFFFRFFRKIHESGGMAVEKSRKKIIIKVVNRQKRKPTFFKFTSVRWGFFRPPPALSGAKIRLGFRKVWKSG